MKSKPAVFQNEKTVYAPRVGATVNRRPNSVTFGFEGVKAGIALIKAGMMAMAGEHVNVRVMDGGTTVGRLVVTTTVDTAAGRLALAELAVAA
jgi:hypothetical protein